MLYLIKRLVRIFTTKKIEVHVISQSKRDREDKLTDWLISMQKPGPIPPLSESVKKMLYQEGCLFRHQAE